MSQRLKSLELHGYKTFANRTLFEFPGDVTAVVGPNGSGKSNIADSIRWVLGEQAYSLLRGKKTEDMIFSGSELRPRSSMAQTTIVFNNEDGWLPIDFSEVSLTRRAYRDGDNEYLLNGQRVRLKEITELLGQSGLSQRTYTVIGQGLVDEALSLRPEERRRFFEEAAGIGLYRSRREESIHKLEATRRNTERVYDILGELAPRLKSLEKQAQKALDFERVRADLKIILRDWYGYHWHRLNGEISTMKETARLQDSRLLESQHKAETIEEIYSGLRIEIQQMRENLSAWHEKAADMHVQLEKVERSKAVQQERQKAVLERNNLINSEFIRTEEEIISQKKVYEMIECQFEKSKIENSQLEGEIQELADVLRIRQEERAKSEITLANTKHQADQINRQIIEKRIRLEDIKERHKKLHLTLQESRKLEDSFNEQFSISNHAMVEAVKEENDLNIKQTEMERNIESLRKALKRHDEKSKELQLELEKKTSELSRNQAQLEVMILSESNLEGLGSGIHYLLDAAREGKLSGLSSPLSQVMDIPEEFEPAITAALGETLEGIILEKNANTNSIIDYLSNAEKGRALLIPISNLKSQTIEGKIDPSQIIGNAAQLVKPKPGNETVVHTLLGSIYVVKDRYSAMRIVPKLTPNAKAVTLTGEVFNGSGIIVAGNENRTSIISRPRKIKALKEKVTNLILENKNAIDDLDSARKEQLVVENQLADIEIDLQKFKISFDEFRRISQRIILDAEQLESSIKNNNTNIQNQIDEIASLEKEICNHEKEIAQFEIDISLSKNKILSISNTLESIPVVEVQAQLSAARTSKAVCAQVLSDLERQLNDRNEIKSSLESRANMLLKQKYDLDIEASSLVTERNELERIGANLLISIEEGQEKINPVEIALRDKEKMLDKVLEDQNAARQALAIVERYATQSHLELARQREALDQLRKRIEEDFGLVAFEYGAEESGQSPLPLEGMVEQLPIITTLPESLEENLSRQKALIRRLGSVNLEAKREYDEVNERYSFLSAQIQDLKQADQHLMQVINELDLLMKKEFYTTFSSVALEFKKFFTRLFGGGSAQLILTDEDDINTTGVDIVAKLPGRREQGLSLLSGGERSLTAVALVFALLKVSPTPFCILDEVDAMLDESNVGRFCDLLNELSIQTQFIVVTHNRNTVQAANVIYGITMGKDSVSQAISLKMDDVSDAMVE